MSEHLEQFIHQLRERAVELELSGNESDFQLMGLAAEKLEASDGLIRDLYKKNTKTMDQLKPFIGEGVELEAAKKLIQDLFMCCREGQNINQYNPCTWIELNAELAKRLIPYMDDEGVERTYEICPAFSYDILCRHSIIIRRELKKYGLENEHSLPFPKVYQLIVPYPIKVTGPIDKVSKFEAAMKDHGYDDKVKSDDH